MKIHIMGASCAGSTMLGEALTAQLGYPYFDTDFYFWEPSEQPFTIKRDKDKRVSILNNAIAPYKQYIIGGSLVNWGDEWLTAFDLVVFLYIPPEIRLQRLKDREFARYGEIIYNEPGRAQAYQTFINWATAYDTNTISGRTLQMHEQWLTRVKCPVLEIRGNTTVQQRIDLVLNKISDLNHL
jgi:adenylate kinase family enzyme